MSGRPERTRLVVAIAGTTLLVLAAPFVGEARSQLRASFPASFSLIVYSMVAAVVVAAVAASLLRVRERRASRLVLLGMAVCVAAAYVAWTGSADPAIRAVETFHFVQYGLITLLFHLAWRHLDDGSAVVLAALAAFIAGVAEEGYQWFLPARVGELRDVWLNAVAIGCGVMASHALAPARFTSWTRRATRRACRMLAAVVVALAAFVHAVHLGVEVRDGDVSFASRYTADALASLARDRESRWRADPPLVRPDRWSREDQYMTEGLQHVQARNVAWAAGDALGAWHENGILERHFAIVLDTPSYVSKTGHRWPPAQRREAVTRAATSNIRAFSSRAYPYPVYTWPPLAVWFAALAAAALLWRAGSVGEA
jgi:VanZ family protein